MARAMERWAATHRVDALVTTGDNVYERGEPELFAAQLDQPYRTLRRGRPLWATLGNHDVSAGHGAEQLRHLGLPDLPYAKSLPGLQLLFLDANRVDQAQASWLDARLSDPAPTCGRWCSTTRPGRAASTTPASRWAGTGCRCSRTTGSRSCSTATTTTTSASSRPGGVTYVVTGGGGRRLYPLDGCASGSPERVAGQVRHHFTAVEVRDGSLAVTAVAADGAVLDRTVIRR
jgi:3',5'-cyclic AMP phosphodiesterase CpdA